MKRIISLITATLALAVIGLGISQSASAETLRVPTVCSAMVNAFKNAEGDLTG